MKQKVELKRAVERFQETKNKLKEELEKLKEEKKNPTQKESGSSGETED